MALSQITFGISEITFGISEITFGICEITFGIYKIPFGISEMSEISHMSRFDSCGSGVGKLQDQVDM